MVGSTEDTVAEWGVLSEGNGLRDCSGRPSSIPSSIWTGYSSSGNISQITDKNANCCSETKPSDD